jgi:predicted DNA-binding protein YlxM (UPF0122 family)
MQITIKHYAENEGISVQSVYAQIKRGSLKSVEENGVKYVLIEDKVIKPKVENTLNEAFKIIKRLQKEIKRLTKKNEKQNTFLISKYENALSPPKKKVDDDIVDVKIKKKKKKKKKNPKRKTKRKTK